MPSRERSKSKVRAFAIAIAVLGTVVAPRPFGPAPARANGDPEPIAHWAMDEGTGTVAADSGALGADLSVGTGQWVQDGHAGAALRFNGSGAAVASATGLHVSDLTVSLWVRGDPDHPPVDGAAIAELGGRAACGHATWGLYVDGSSFHFGWMDGGAAQFQATEGWAVEGHDLWDGTWHHIAVSVSADPYAYILQRIDGFMSGGTQSSPDLDYDGIVLDHLMLGDIAGNCNTPPGFRGDIDDVRLYDQQLTSDQIGGLEPPIATSAVLTGPTTALTGESPCFDLDVTPGPVGGDLDIAMAPAIGLPIHHSLTWAYPGHAVICLAVTPGTYDVSATFSNGRPWVSASTSAIHLDVAKRISSSWVDGRFPQLSSASLKVDGFVDGHGEIATGDIAFYEIVNGDRVPLGTGALAYTGTDQRSVATVTLPPRAAGTYAFEIDYAGDANHSASTGAGSIDVSTAPDLTPPTVTAPTWFVMSGKSLADGKPQVRVMWSGSDVGLGVEHYEIAESVDGGTYATFATSTMYLHVDRSVALGHTHRFRVRAVDFAGNIGSWVAGPTSRFSAVAEWVPAVHYHGPWSTGTSTTSFWGGSTRASSTASATASYTFTGRSITWVGLTSRTRGKAQVYINGALAATVDLWSSTLRTKHLIWQTTFATSATRTIMIKVLGTPGRARVDVDGFIVGT